MGLKQKDYEFKQSMHNEQRGVSVKAKKLIEYLVVVDSQPTPVPVHIHPTEHGN